MPQRLPLLALLTLAACSLEPAPEGRVLHVQPPVGGEWDDPDAMRGVMAFTTIQDAVDAAISGDTIAVPAGIYLEDVVMADGVTVQGAGRGQTYVVGSFRFTSLTGAAVESLSLYDSTWYTTGTSQTQYGVVVNGGDASVSNIEAFYFQHAISVSSAASVDVDAVRLGGNLYGVVDGGTSDLSVTNSFIYSNTGGGVATSNGGSGSTAVIANNTLVANGYGGTTAYLTGAISMGTNGAEQVYNNIITNNSYGLNCGGCGASWGYNLVWGNSTGYVNDASSVGSDRSRDPLYADTSSGDYRLSAGSPAIDAGTATWAPATDLDGEARPQGGGIDIGMDEYASSSYDLIITEVMANAATEGTGEFVEIYNNGSTSIDLAGLVLSDGDQADTLQAYGTSSTVLAAGAYAVVVDSEYASDYTIDSSVPLLTTGDTNLGNGMTTADPVTLYEADGSTVIAAYSHVGDPGDGVSREMVILANGDAAGNWRASVCSTSSSPGEAACFPPSGDPADLVITEVMANAATESTGEYVEVYNPTTSDIDLAGLVISDGGSTDTLTAFQGGSTLLAPGQHGLILDEGYAFDYFLPTDAVLVSAGTTIGNGLSTSDSVTLYESDGTTAIDSFSFGFDPGDGVSAEKVDYAAGDTAANWVAGTDSCTRGATPARLNGAAGGICAPLLVTEVMANADDEDTGEFVEIFNYGGAAIDLAGLMLSDGDAMDTLQAYDGGATLLPSGGYAVVVDAEYTGEHNIPAGVIVVTTGDTTLGNSLSVSDEVTLYEADGVHVIDAFQHPSNPGNAVSIERVALSGLLDDVSNWTASTCARGSSPGQDNCVSSSSTSTSSSPYDILITEVMANADSETTGEFVELYNNGTTDVDLLYWYFYDGDAIDTIVGFSDIYDTVLPAGGYAIILDADYNGDYASTLSSSALILTTDDTTLGSGLSTSDEIYVFDADAALADSFTSPSNPGNAVSIERLDLNTGDVPSNWDDSACSTGSSPGQGTCP